MGQSSIEGASAVSDRLPRNNRQVRAKESTSEQRAAHNNIAEETEWQDVISWRANQHQGQP